MEIEIEDDFANRFTLENWLPTETVYSLMVKASPLFSSDPILMNYTYKGKNLGIYQSIASIDYEPGDEPIRFQFRFNGKYRKIDVLFVTIIGSSKYKIKKSLSPGTKIS